MKSALGEGHTLPIKGGKTKEPQGAASLDRLEVVRESQGAPHVPASVPASLPQCLAQHGLHTDFPRAVLASPHQARGGDSASRQQAFQKLGRRRYAVGCQSWDQGPSAQPL